MACTEPQDVIKTHCQNEKQGFGYPGFWKIPETPIKTRWRWAQFRRSTYSLQN